MIDILRACADSNLFGQWFKKRQTWEMWFAFLAALFALPMDDAQTATYRKHTGRMALPEKPFSEAWLIVGRRGGKSFVLALIAVYLATFRQYKQYLQPGERATIRVIAADRKQARTIMNYVRGMLTNIPMLRKLIGNETAEAFDLTNGVTIEIGTASYKSSRGYTYAAVLCDELAFWPTDDSAEPDYAILNAIRPGMSTIPGAMLLCASSPYARRGALWDAYNRMWGKADKPLVWKATTREMNPAIDQQIIDEAMERDPASASAEYLAEFRTDVETLLTREAVQSCIDQGAYERQYAPGIRYHGFVDPSGGSSDSMTLAIAHFEDDTAVLDAVREVKPKFSPDAVTREFAALLQSYGLSSVTGDRYGGEWPREKFRSYGINYELSPQTRSDLYLALVPAINSGRIALLDLPTIENQLIALERRTSRAGRDIVDHPPGQHDDLANAAAGALVTALTVAGKPKAFVASFGYGGKVTMKSGDAPARIWHRGPGISAVDGKPSVKPKEYSRYQ
ncbi:MULTISPECIES: terminase large subunit domain-containing protein [unclassified Phyllobacterium]|uniref:terminase large subunit domain-containing protein n=1 Tax=unclassified Phyllobacterium TaxID=2638441 RepID=UPI0030130AC9